jgi:hypothetical protein
MEIKVNGKVKVLPERIGLLPSWKNNWLRKCDKKDPEIDYKWMSILFDEDVELFRNMSDEEFMKLIMQVNEFVKAEVIPVLKQDINVAEDNKSE